MKNLVSSHISKKSALLLTTAVAFVVLFSLLHYGRAFQVSEAREGVVVQEIIDSGNLVLPLRNGHIVPSKPVFFHWIAAAVALVRGQVDEFVIRFPSALGALGCVLAVTALLLGASSAPAALMAGAALLSLNGFVRLAADGRVDMLFCCFVTAAICVWLSAASKFWQDSQSLMKMPSRTYLAVALLTGLSVLTKGPLGLVLVGLVLGTVVISVHGLRGVLIFLRWEWGMTLLLSIPWYLAAAMSGGESFVGRQIFFENIRRFTGAQGITPKPPWFYLEQLPLQAAPWSFVLAFLLVKMFKWRRENGGWRAAWEKHFSLSLQEKFLLRAAALWAGSMLIFYSLSIGKRGGYLLTLSPAIAIVVSLLTVGVWRRLDAENSAGRFDLLCGTKLFRGGLLLWAFVALIVFGVFSGSYLKWGTFELVSLSRAYERYAAAALSASTAPTFFVLLLFSSLVLWLRAFRLKDASAALLAVFLFVVSVMSPVVASGYALKGVTHSYYEFAQEVKKLVPESTKLFFVKTLKDESFDGFFFYFKRHVQYIPPKEILSTSGLYLARARWLDKQPVSYLRFIKILTEGGRLTDEPGEKLILFQFDSPVAAAGALTVIPSAAVPASGSSALSSDSAAMPTN